MDLKVEGEKHTQARPIPEDHDSDISFFFNSMFSFRLRLEIFRDQTDFQRRDTQGKDTVDIIETDNT